MKEKHFTDYFTWRISFGAQTVLLLFLSFLIQNKAISQPGCTPACNSTNISIGPDCIADVTLQMVATFSPGCGDAYRINLRPTMTGPILETIDNGDLLVDGIDLQENTYEYIGKRLVVEVIDLASGNKCWNWHLFEDKLPPIVTCGQSTVFCWEDWHFAGIDPNDCSLPIKVTVLDSLIEELNCTISGDTLRKIYRSFYAEDSWGNKSITCTDTINVMRADTADINWPVMDTLYCDQDYLKDSNGNPSPYVTGFPTIGESLVPLWPGIAACNLFTDYTDRIINLGCDKKIMRTWNINEWFCGADSLYSRVQLILIKDTLPPELTVPYDVTVSTDNGLCTNNFRVPAASASDNCQGNLNWKVSWSSGYRNQNGGFNVTLPVGTHTFIYTVNDGCSNQAVDSMHVTVVDDVSPNAICVEYTVATIPSGTDYVRVPASSFDNGSWDNCGPVTLKVRRMNPDCYQDADTYTTAPGYDYLDFHCCDATGEPIQVILRVIDASGNYSECMVSIKIQDKTPPTIVCPPNFEIPCILNWLVDFDFTDTVQLNHYFGRMITNGTPSRRGYTHFNVYGGSYEPEVEIDGRATDNCGLNVTQTVDVERGSCGVIHVTRHFTATDPFGNTRSCSQEINVYSTPLNVRRADRRWMFFDDPADTTIINGACSVDDLSPDALGDRFKPRFRLDSFGINCFNLAYNYKDEVYQIVDGACFKIIRTWTVIDWCWAERYGIESALNHAAVFTHVIKVMNNIAPSFTPIADFELVSDDATCTYEQLDISAIAHDDCTTDNLLKYDYRIDLNYSSSGVPTWDRYGLGSRIVQDLPLGKHRICFRATDGCTNSTEMCFVVTVVNRKKPSPVAHTLVTEIMPSTGSITLPAYYFDAGSFSACGGSVRFSFSQDVNDIYRTFTCDDIGNNPPASVEFWVTDEWGNQDYTVVEIEIQDNNNVCDTTSLSRLAGNILTPSVTQGIPQIDVTAGSNMHTRTSTEGKYKFGAIQFGNTYVVRPESSLDPQNGVETGDIIKIQNHILGKKLLDDPYKMIAADVTMDNEIKGSDIINIRRLILGKIDQFPSGKSWRFVDKNYNFSSNNPLTESYPEQISVTPTQSLNNIDFYGVKLGDVNGSVKLNVKDGGIGIRGDQKIALTAADQIIPAGVPTTVEFKVNNLSDIEGLQLALHTVNGVKINSINSSNLNFDDENYNIIGNNSRISWTANGSQFSEGSILVTLTSAQTMNLSDMVELNNGDLSAQAYGKDESIYNVELKFAETLNHSVVVYQNRPNPFSGETAIGFVLPEQMDVTVNVYDLNGKVVFSKTENYAKGENELRIGANELQGNGVFIYEVSTKYGKEMKRMVRIQN